MAYCGPKGIPHSEFLKWSELDQDKALASLLAERTRCARCGTVPGDWLDEEGRDREPPPYVAIAELCIGCDVLSEKRESVPEKMRDRYHVYLVPRGVANGSRKPSSSDSPPG